MKNAKALSLTPLLAVLALPGLAVAQTHLDNPFSGAKMYVNPDYTAKANAEAALVSNATLAANMRAVGQQPTAVWMDRISAVASLPTHLDQALAQGANLFLGVVYDLPGRDCAALASNGELPGTAEGLARYKAEYIDAIAAVVGQSKYANLRIVFVIEPDSLPNLVTNLSDPECSAMNSGGYYVQGVQYAINKLRTYPNVYTYVDMAHSGWLGWTSNNGPFVQLMSTLANGLTLGKAGIDGFVANTANTLPLREPFMTATQTVGGQQVMSNKFYEYNPMIDEVSFVADMWTRFTGAGFPTSLGMMMDTSRNGWGGPNRPTAASTSTDLTTFVNASKVDRRAHRGLWCNPAGAGIGERPSATTGIAHVDAFAWVKPPGESDGSSTEIPNDQGKRLDRMCDPTYTTQYGVLTGALAGAPLSGDWFGAQFQQLVANAYPPLSGGGTTYSLAVTKSGSGSGTVSGGAINCGATCSATFTAATTVTLTATAASGSSFAGWSGACTGTAATCAVSVNGAQAVGATFNTTGGGTTYALNVSKAGTGAGTVSGAGIDCGATCSATYSSGTTVTLSATAASGSTFTGWSGACTGSSATCSVSMTAARTVTATFNSTGGGTSIVAQHGRLRVCGNRVCNAAGTPVQLKGMSWFWSNTGWGAERFYNRTAVASVKGWGATVVRAALGVHGGGGYVSGDSLSPADPSGNMARVRALIDAAIAEGVYVIVDWHSHELLQSQAQSFFQQLASAYASSPNIIWETFNEPPGTTYSWSTLKPYHTAVINSIRQAGSQNLVIVGSPNWSQDVDVASADPISDANTAYTLHFYAGTHTQYLRDKGNTAMSRGRALFVTEWGTCDASGNGNFSASESQNWANWMDQNLISSANWSLNDKAETASALVAGASATGPWADSALTQSGLWVKAYIAKTTGGGTTYALNVTKSGTGSGTVTSSTGGINCGSTCSATIASGTTVTLTAAAASGSTFAGWSNGCSGTASTCTVSMTAARTVNAAFNTSGGTTYTLSVTKSGTGSGTVTSSTGGINCGSTCSASIAANTTVTLTAAAASGSTFAGWSNGCSGTASTCTVSMSAARTVNAAFNTSGGTTYTLSVTKSGTGSGTVAGGAINCGSTCSASVASGTTVVLTATAASGSTFAGWSGACSGTASTCTVSMTAARTVTATFNTSGSGTTPCANPITFTGNTNNFNTTGAVCYRTSATVNGWGCYNMDGRTIRINGNTTATACGAGPLPLAKHSDGFTYFSVSAGTYAWAGLYTW
jgi:cellulose 1,4-beta-cellobiosidase